MEFLRRLLGRKTPPQRDEDRFAQRVMEALQKAIPDLRVEYDAEAFELIHLGPGKASHRMFLYNSFAEYQRLGSDEERGNHLARLIQFTKESREPRPRGDAALDKLLPVLRSRADMLATLSGQDGFSYSKTSRPFCETMLVMLALDFDASIALVTDETLDELGVSFDEALGIAAGYLDERGDHKFGQLAEGTFISSCGDFYDASRILLPDLFLQLPLKGNPVAIVQSRSSVLVTGSEDMEGLAMIAGFALDDLPQMERAVAINPIELVDGKWRPFDIRPDHPQRLKNLAPNQLVWAYTATQATVQKLLGEDIFVASALLVERDGMAATAATWAAGVPTACPLVDAILIEEDGSSPQIVRSLADVLKVCGPFEEVQAFPHPPRWMLPAQMSAEQRKDLTDNYPEHDFFGSIEQ